MEIGKFLSIAESEAEKEDTIIVVRLRFVACVCSAVRFWKIAEQSNTPSTFLVSRVFLRFSFRVIISGS